jgi:hypothetical protein
VGFMSISMTAKKKFRSPKIQCNNCKDIIFSRYPGEYVICKCRSKSNETEQQIYTKLMEYIPETMANDTEYGKQESTEGHLIRCALASVLNKGIMIDATEDYMRSSGSYTVIEEGNINNED